MRVNINHESLRIIAVCAFLGALLYFLNVSFISWMFSAFPSSYALVFGKGSWWLGASVLVKIVYVGVVSPVVEEVIFRKGILGYFVKRKQNLFGLLFSTVIFGLYHMLFGWGPLKAVLMIVPGLVFGVLYLKYGFKGCLAGHLSNNMLAVWALVNV